MKTKIRNLSIYTITTLLILGGVAIADKLIPEGDTSTPTMYTLTDIYNKLTAGTEASTHDISTTSLPTESMNTLQEIYDSIPAFLTGDTSNATSSRTGTTITLTIPAGISNGTPTLSTSSADLISDNIMEGKTIFGVEGSAPTGGGAPALTWSADHPAGQVDWITAQEYCTSLGAGWKLPTYQELVTKYLTTNPENTAGFQTDVYWSSTEYPSDSVLAYSVSMGYGDAIVGDKTNPYSYVRCVH